MDDGKVFAEFLYLVNARGWRDYFEVEYSENRMFWKGLLGGVGSAVWTRLVLKINHLAFSCPKPPLSSS
jgi:hypothetical protein